MLLGPIVQAPATDHPDHIVSYRVCPGSPGWSDPVLQRITGVVLEALRECSEEVAWFLYLLGISLQICIQFVDKITLTFTESSAPWYSHEPGGTAGTAFS